MFKRNHPPSIYIHLYPTSIYIPISRPFSRLSGAPSNATALAVLGHLERLHGTLRRAARKQKEQLVERQLQQSVRQLQRQAQLQLRSLGVYRLETWLRYVEIWEVMMVIICYNGCDGHDGGGK